MPDLKVRRNDCHAVSECEYLFYEAKTVLRLKKASKSAVWWHHVCVYEAPPSLPGALFRDCGAYYEVFERGFYHVISARTTDAGKKKPYCTLKGIFLSKKLRELCPLDPSGRQRKFRVTSWRDLCPSEYIVGTAFHCLSQF